MRGHVLVVGTEWETALVFTVPRLDEPSAHRCASLTRDLKAEFVAFTEIVILKNPQGGVVRVSVAILFPSGRQQAVSLDDGRQVVCGRVRTASRERFSRALKAVRQQGPLGKGR